MEIIQLDKREIVELYVLLTSQDQSLDLSLLQLLERLEHCVFQEISIEDIESLQSGGRKAIEAVLRKMNAAAD